eukprot:SM000055S18267  [mRNA]  locus=s55:416584:417743:+ [translate_table: standard]
MVETREYVAAASVAVLAGLAAYYTYRLYSAKTVAAAADDAAEAEDEDPVEAPPPEGPPAKRKVEAEVVMEKDHGTFLTDMAAKYGLPDADKALRVAITYAMAPAHEQVIYGKVRCTHCKYKRKTKTTRLIEAEHQEFLEEMVKRHKLADRDKALRIIVDYAMIEDGPKDDIFGVARCLHGEACKSC